MSCVDVPTPALPPLPTPFSIPALPAPPPITAGLCCQSLTLTVPPLPGSVGPQTPAVITAINAAIAVVQAYIDALPPTCPRNS